MYNVGVYMLSMLEYWRRFELHGSGGHLGRVSGCGQHWTDRGQHPGPAVLSSRVLHRPPVRKGVCMYVCMYVLYMYVW